VDLVAVAQEHTDGPRIEFIHNFRFRAEAWIAVITADRNQRRPRSAIVASTDGAGNVWVICYKPVFSLVAAQWKRAGVNGKWGESAAGMPSDGQRTRSIVTS